MFLTVLSVVGLCGLSLPLLQAEPALGAELNGFAIQTQEASKTVTITLFTDQRVPYATEHHGKQFAIVLPNTQISPSQLKNGLPVIVDNQNRFIGRAVPAEDGKVRIVLPNLSVNDYAVSIQQKRSPSGAAAGGTSNRIRPALTINSGNAFEQAVASLPKVNISEGINPNKPNNERHSETASRPLAAMPSVSGLSNTGNLIWNPYTVNMTPPEAVKSMPLASELPTAKSAAPDSFPKLNLTPIASLPLPGLSKDPLWALHALPEATPNASVTQDFKKLAADDALLQKTATPTSAPTAETKSPPAAATVITSQGIAQEVKASIQSLPPWLLIPLAIFLGGIGVFTLVGGLVLLKVLFSQMILQLTPAPLNISLAKLVKGEEQAIQTTSDPLSEIPLGASVEATLAEQVFVTAPENRLKTRLAHRTAFQDISRVSALDYLKESPNNVTQAVHNTGLVKFPAQKKNRTSVAPASTRRQRAASNSMRP